MTILSKILYKNGLNSFRFINGLTFNINKIRNNYISKFSFSTTKNQDPLKKFNNSSKDDSFNNRLVYSTLNRSHFILESNLVYTGYEKKVGCSGLTAFIMGFGAYVRLNESGLSMVDWNFLGLPLPKDDFQWNQEFEKYKEWLHRMVGRVSGIFFGLGSLYFGLTKALKPAGYILLLGIGSIGIYQAFVGKWMVESGFFEPKTENKTPRVSPYRLCFHFLNALGIYSLCFYNGLNLLFGNLQSITVTKDLKRVRLLAKTTTCLALFTMIYGTFVAGNDSGLVYNTWPLMDGKFFPEQLSKLKNIRSYFENNGLVQFNHRNLAYLTILSSFATLIAARKGNVSISIKKMSMGVLHSSILQGIVGIITLLQQVPIHGALTHHVNAVVLWSVILSLLRVLR